MKNFLIKITVLLVAFSMNWQESQAQTLDSLLQLAVSQNTELKALEAGYKAKLATADQVSQLQNPQLGIGVPILRPETRLGPQIMMVSASQLFPWFGTLKAKKDVAISMSKVQYEKIAALKLNLFYSIKSNYYELLFIAEKQAILEAEIKLIESIEQLSLTKVESGQGSITDVLRIQIKKEEVKKEIAVLQNLQTSAVARLNEITKLPLNTEIVVRDSLNSILPLVVNMEEYQNKISAHHPLMLQLNAEIEASENRLIVNSAGNKPSIGLGLDYSLVNPRIDANPEDNGRDILIPKLMFSIPIYRKSYNATREIESFNREALEWEKISFIDKMTRQIIEYMMEYENAKLLVELGKKQHVLAAQTFEILLSNYSTNSAGFDDLITIQSQLLNYELQILTARFQARIAGAKIERLTDF